MKTGTGSATPCTATRLEPPSLAVPVPVFISLAPNPAVRLFSNLPTPESRSSLRNRYFLKRDRGRKTRASAVVGLLPPRNGFSQRLLRMVGAMGNEGSSRASGALVPPCFLVAVLAGGIGLLTPPGALPPQIPGRARPRPGIQLEDAGSPRPMGWEYYNPCQNPCPGNCQSSIVQPARQTGLPSTSPPTTTADAPMRIGSAARDPHCPATPITSIGLPGERGSISPPLSPCPCLLSKPQPPSR